MNPPACPHRNTVLVIDDDPDIVQTIRGNLELDGYEVLSAHDGFGGLDLCRSRRPDLVILDLNLPDIDGIKACEVMRRMCDVPIIMLTARDAIADKVLGLECGADDYMIKPFNFLELSARIKAVLKRITRSKVEEQYDAHGLTVNFKSRSVAVRGCEVKLTKTEFALLELFMTYPDEVLSRDFIQKRVWYDAQLYQHSRVVDVHVQRLRKKIEPDTDTARAIATIAGVGYRFTPPSD